jgi:hypothetical protein
LRWALRASDSAAVSPRPPRLDQGLDGAVGAEDGAAYGEAFPAGDVGDGAVGAEVLAQLGELGVDAGGVAAGLAGGVGRRRDRWPRWRATVRSKRAGVACGSRAKLAGTRPMRTSIIRPTPFWPSLLPWAKLTPEQVAMRSARTPGVGGTPGTAAASRPSVAGVAPREEEQARGGSEAEEGRDHEGEANLRGLGPVDAVAEAVAGQEGVGHADAEDGADEGVRAGGGEAEVPGAEVPADGGEEEGEDHGEADPGARRDQQLDGQQLDDAEGDGDAAEKHAEEVADAREHHGVPWA